MPVFGGTFTLVVRGAPNINLSKVIESRDLLQKKTKQNSELGEVLL